MKHNKDRYIYKQTKEKDTEREGGKIMQADKWVNGDNR